MAQAPAYGWLIGLTNYMNQTYGAKWCYSGSFAMYCHGAVQGKQAREPQDIDIIVERVDTAWFDLRSQLDGQLSGPPGATARHAKIKNCTFNVVSESGQAVNRQVDVDLLKSGSYFGDYTKAVAYNQKTTILRVASISELKSRQQMLIDDEEKDETDMTFLNSLTV